MDRIPECGCTTRDPIPKLRPLPGLSCDRVDVEDVVFPSRLVWTVQGEVVDGGGGEVWDRREQGSENHGRSQCEMEERGGKGHIPLILRCGGAIV